MASALESSKRKIILPIWHGIEHEVVAEYSPLLAGKVGIGTDRGLGAVATQILQAVVPLRSLDVPLERFFPEDRQLFEDLQEVFNRPAFRGPFLWQTDPEPFRRAMKLTIKAINTGEIESNTGEKRKTIEPISRIRDAKLHARMQEVETQLKTVTNLVEILQAAHGNQTTKIIGEIDKRRDYTIGALNKIWSCFGLHVLPLPTAVTDSTDVWEDFSQ
jgi:hypothetical protein